VKYQYTRITPLYKPEDKTRLKKQTPHERIAKDFVKTNFDPRQFARLLSHRFMKFFYSPHVA